MPIQEKRSRRYDNKDRIEHHLRNVFKPKLKSRPFLEKISRDFWHTLYWIYIKAVWKKNSILYFRSDIIDIHKLIWINPSKIQYCALNEFDINKYKGRVLDGEWDHLSKKFENLDLFLAIKSVCIEGRHWQETEFYNKVLVRLNQGKRAWKCNNIDELVSRCEGIKSLFQDIQKNGYKIQYEILKQKQIYHPLKHDDEIVISIGRNGDLLFSDGAHRLSIAKLLALNKIPTKIAVRHQEWLHFRQELKQYANNNNGKLPQPIDHPDLASFSTQYDCYERLSIIRKNIPSQKGLMLDIDAKFGFFCDKFEEKGFTCYAMEESKSLRYFLEKVRRMQNRTFKILPGSRLNSSEILNTQFNIQI
jgi:RNAse (barnase) inhibitor barstar